MIRWTCASAIGLLLAGTVPAGAAEQGHEVRGWHGLRGRLGVSLEDVQADDVGRLGLKAETGARVRKVADDSPAEAAGLKEDDVILRYQGETVHSASQLARLVRETPPGRKVALDVSRQGAVQQLTATLAEGKGMAFSLGNLESLQELENLGNLIPPEPPLPPEVPEVPSFQWKRDSDLLGDEARDAVRRALRTTRGPRLGIRYHELSDQLAAYFKVEEGVLVSSVDEGSAAAKAGVKAGDVIVKLNGRKVSDASDLGREVARLAPGEDATLTVQRDGQPVDLKVTVSGSRPKRVPTGPTT